MRASPLTDDYVSAVVSKAVSETPAATVQGVMSMHTSHANVSARRVAWADMRAAKYCGALEIARVFGCTSRTVSKALGDKLNDGPQSPESGLAARLIWTKGPERARTILSGKDPAVLADIERWNALVQRSAA